MLMKAICFPSGRHAGRIPDRWVERRALRPVAGSKIQSPLITPPPALVVDMPKAIRRLSGDQAGSA